MTRIETFLRIAQTGAAAAAALVLAGASAAAARGIDVPPQAFGQGQADAKPVVAWRPNASRWDRAPADGKSFDVNVPLGAGARLPLTVHLLSSEAQCHDDHITSAHEDQEDGFIRDGRNRKTDFSR